MDCKRRSLRVNAAEGVAHILAQRIEDGQAAPFPMGLGHGGYCPTVEGRHDVRRDLDAELRLAELADDRVDAAGGDDLVADLERVLHRGVHAGAPPLGHGEQEPAEGEDDCDHDHGCHASRSSASRL